MRTRTLCMTIIGLLFCSGILWAQAQQAPEDTRRRKAPQVSPSQDRQPGLRIEVDDSFKDKTTLTTIMKTKYISADKATNLIVSLFEVNAVEIVDGNTLIVKGPTFQVDAIKMLLAEIDVPPAKTSAWPQADQADYVYRVYMLEAPPEQFKGQTFSLTILSEEETDRILSTSKSFGIKVSEFNQQQNENGKGNVLRIKGCVRDPGTLSQFTKELDCEVWDMQLRFEQPVQDQIVQASYQQLPKELSNHAQRFLGENIQVVGYWFGNVSLNGEVQAPIGPWKLRLEIKEDSEKRLRFEIDVTEPPTVTPDGKDWMISSVLSNTLSSPMGKPIIIGYNREIKATRTMGAILIVPEEAL